MFGLVVARLDLTYTDSGLVSLRDEHALDVL